ncbi:MAG: hypothetical protein AAGA44_15215 [Pseudomonadota bacterium]
MSLDHLVADIESLQADGAVVLLKWDGERVSDKRTVVVFRPGADYTFRRDSDDIAESLQLAVDDYRRTFG